ncbi:GntR family transcriptional regulator [Corynebacterium sputi]|uniref:GntR family transcriptional regulator n=1 Tax=Corynebacterium sputi TaxID=489915 RepID=UPI00040ED99F|nr:GntR family transcriptional regulator [Corynebacterium sputi]
MQDTRPIYVQIADEIRGRIADGSLSEGTRVPSTNELADQHSVNPTTSGKALSSLQALGVLQKRRGLGMFVAEGARDRILSDRRESFAEDFIAPLLQEAYELGLSDADLTRIIDRERGRR